MMVKPSQEAVWKLLRSLQLHREARLTPYGVMCMHTSLPVHFGGLCTKIARADACA